MKTSQLKTKDKQVADSESKRSVLDRLHDTCSITLRASYAGSNSVQMADSLTFASEIGQWAIILKQLPEYLIFRHAEAEYLTSLLCMAEGKYRSAFKGLRLVLELILQSVYLSANALELHEWTVNQRDTIWSKLMDMESGPFSIRFCRVFFPDLENHAPHFRTLASTLYRELSEAVHGNPALYLPETLSFVYDEEAFSAWHSKAKSVRMIMHFIFALRYLRFIPENQVEGLATILSNQVGHINAIRAKLGGPTG